MIVEVPLILIEDDKDWSVEVVNDAGASIATLL